MKGISFVSNVNGLVVSAPADAYPAPNCSDTMCPIQEQAEAFACTPQLNPASPSPLMFPVEVEAAGESYVGASYTTGGGWSTGDGPAGAPTGTTVFNVSSAEGGFSINYNDAAVHEDVEVTLYDEEGNVVASGAMVNISTTLWRLQINTPGFPTLEDGATYCVQITITNGIE